MKKSRVADSKNQQEIKNIQLEGQNQLRLRREASLDKQMMNLVLAGDIYKTAKEHGQKMIETEEWAQQQDNIDVVKEKTWYGERTAGYKVAGIDKMQSVEQIQGRKEQSEADALAAAQVGDEGELGSTSDKPSPMIEDYNSQQADRKRLESLGLSFGYGEEGDRGSLEDWGATMGMDFIEDFRRKGDKSKGIVEGSTDWSKMLDSVMSWDGS